MCESHADKKITLPKDENHIKSVTRQYMKRAIQMKR